TDADYPQNAKKELLRECEDIWKQMKECQSQLTLLGIETPLQSDSKLSLLLLQWKTLTADCQQWHVRDPEVISTNPDVLLELGKEELERLKNDLEMVLSTTWSKNKKLEEDLEREQQWIEEQEQLLNILNRTEEEAKMEAEQLSKRRGNQELKNEIMKLNIYKKELLNALGEFLDKHFPVPREDKSTEKKNSFAEPNLELLGIHEILEILIKKLVTTPHEPYITISESFWPPYVELLLRYGIVLRHPEDPNRIRLEAFHK
ncbi:CENPK protein, partial [Serilophus lunatus]|nr:CENPK protein [Serilophus lunatus]